MGWWAVGICTLIMFTFYGIEGIASQLEDPFGYDRNDIKMDAIVLDTKTELEVILEEWRKTTAVAEIAAKTSASSTTSQTNGEKKFVQPDMFVRARPNTSISASELVQS